MALLNGAAIFMGTLGGGGFLFSNHYDLPYLLVAIYLLAYVLIVIAGSVMTQVLMIQRYYKKTAANESNRLRRSSAFLHNALLMPDARYPRCTVRWYGRRRRSLLLRC